MPPPKHLELPSDSPAGWRGLTWGKLQQRPSGFQVTITTAPTKGSRKYPQNAIPSPPDGPQRTKSMPLITLTPRQTQAHCHSGHHPSSHAVTLLNSCMTNSALHSCRQVPNVFGFFSENKIRGSTSNRQPKWAPLFGTPSAVPKLNTIWLLTVLHSLLAHRTGLPEWLQLSGEPTQVMWILQNNAVCKFLLNPQTLTHHKCYCAFVFLPVLAALTKAELCIMWIAFCSHST